MGRAARKEILTRGRGDSRALCFHVCAAGGVVRRAFPVRYGQSVVALPRLMRQATGKAAGQELGANQPEEPPLVDSS
ncbi:MAG: hypothetical protein KatS3mg109_0489 [Pirellulaceae bacterium]|nr:MAG: hypothetical protein KatS3mg109_0489 [Pirellulaceae bacterium]